MRIPFVTIVAVLAVLVAACDGSHSTTDPKPTASGTTAATPTPSPSRTGPLTTGPGVQPGEKPPVLTADAKAHTPTGALLFATYFVRALDWTVATNDAYLLQHVGAASCKACQRDIDAVEALHREGARETSGRTVVVSSKIVTGSFEVKSDYVVQVITRDEAIVIQRPGSPPSTAAPAVARDVSLVFVSWVAGRWQVVEEGAPS